MVKVFDSNDLSGLFSGFPVEDDDADDDDDDDDNYDDDDDNDTTVKKFPKNVKKFGPDFIRRKNFPPPGNGLQRKKSENIFFNFISDLV